MAINQEKLKLLLKKHIDKVFVGALLADLLVIFVLTFGEKSNPDPVPLDVAVRDPQVRICLEPGKDCSEPFEKAQTLLAQHRAFEDSAFKPLADFNMFDPKSARSSEELEKRADQAAVEAQTLFDQGQIDQARAKVEEAFKYSYSHKGARKLLTQIEIKLKPAGEGPSGAPDKAPAKPPAPAAVATPPKP